MSRNNISSLLNFRYRQSVTLILLCFCILTINSQTVDNGILDLRNSTSLKEKVIDLSGKWQFYYGKHLSSSEIKDINRNEIQFIEAPSSWNCYKIDKKQIPTFGIATYNLKIILNNHIKNQDSSYGFKVGNIISAYKLWVNGKLVGKAGILGLKKSDFRPIYLPQTCYFETQKDTLDVVLQVSNYIDPLYAGVWQKIYFGTSEKIEAFDWLKKGLTFFFLSTFLIFFLYHFSIAFVQKKDISHRFIALLSIIAFVKLLSDGDVSIYYYFPNLNHDVYYRLWLLTFLIFPITLRLTLISYPNESRRFIDRTFFWFYNIMFFYIITFNVQFILKNIYIIVIPTFFCGIYLLYILATHLFKRKRYSVMNFISFSVMLAFIVNDLVFLSSQFTNGYLAHYGIFFYIFVQSILVTSKFAQSHKNVLVLSNELAEANKNLEKLVAVRTKELYDANIELAQINKQKDFLISTISHDLMGFFNTLLTFTRALSKDKSLSENQQKTMSKLFQTSNKGFLLLDNILSWAKIQVSNKPRMNIIDNLTVLIEENIYLLEEQIDSKSLKVNLEIDNSLSFNCNIGNLNTIIRNILSNAIKYSHGGGLIEISNQIKNGNVQIIIHDNGIGLLYEQLVTVFNGEMTKKREGTAGERGSGLGLMIVKELVENNNGKIYCTSQLNYGTSFIIAFPRI
jgi:signal transduction histidine kinase